MDLGEDQTAPIGQREILEVQHTNRRDEKSQIIKRILSALNERRDAYSGIISSIGYVIDSDDSDFIKLLEDGLIDLITSTPMRYGGKMFISKTLARLVDERPLFVMDLFECILQTSSDWSTRFDHESEVLKIQITSLKAIRQAEQSRGSRPTCILKDTIDLLCSKAIFNCDDCTKIDTLSLVLEQRSTTKPLEDKELYLFQVLFEDALSLQEPALRQIFIAQTNKLLKRLKDSHKVVVRDKKLYTDDQRSVIINRYHQFLIRLIGFCLNSIYCNAYFGSFILTITTLKLVIEHITFSDEFLPIEHLFKSRLCYDSILSCLNDSFEENKTLALELLFLLPYNEEFYNEVNLNGLENIAYHLVESVNPAHSLTCQFIFKMLIGLKSRQQASQVTKNQLLIKHLGRLTEMVEDGLVHTREDFVSALKQKPIYPKLSCIRALLDEIDIHSMESDRESWEKLARRTVINSIDACKAVSTIVCNLNPETIGHLPMDLKPVDADTLAKTLKVSLKIPDSKLNTITSQMLLISGWKTIKECSLSLGAMCIRFWWPSTPIKVKKEKFPGLKTRPILNSDDITMIIDFFDHYLRNLRHRGAFEQAYNGFMMVTRRVWHDEHFKGLLITTLHHIMNDFKSEALDSRKAECLKAYVTRRSAGLPFIVQAILNSEHKHDSQTLRWVMDSLFEVLESDNAELYQRIHCLNILKALIKEHFLGEKVISYIGKTFAITMDSFKSDSFPIRNCANMLLKAIVDRTFGVNRLRNDIHRRNQLSFERFFSECPDLHAIMLKHLEDGLVDERSLATVHSVFIVLFRLRPSLNPSPEYSADNVIKPFIKPIVQLAYCCRDYKLRELAGELTVRLEVFCNGTDNRAQYLQVVEELTSKGSNPEDWIRLHGAIAIAKNWVKIGATETDSAALSLFVQKTTRDICQTKTDPKYPKSMTNEALELAEAFCINNPHDKHWLIGFDSLIQVWQIYLAEDKREPYIEKLLFKTTTVLLMGVDSSSMAASERLDNIVKFMIKIIIQKPNRTLSVNLKASITRFFRQVLSDSDDYVDKLLERLDIDPTASHMTPYDHLRLMHEFDSEKEKLLKYCDQPELKNYLAQSHLLRQIFNFTYHEEFLLPNLSGQVEFSPRVSNTPFSIELLALACKNWSKFQLDKNSIWMAIGENMSDKLRFLTDFTSSLPDCDVRCLALLCAGKMMAAQIVESLSSRDSSSLDGNGVEVMECFTKLLDELADGDHSLTIRETCSQVLQVTLNHVVKTQSKQLQACLMNLLSALIKLSQDEESEIRSSSQLVILSLEGIRAIQNHNRQSDYMIGNRLEHLIRLITTQLFDPNLQDEINNCFELLMRIVFNHAKNYSNDVHEEKEKLFDKTKLNTFADHVATIQSSLEGLKIFFARRTNKSDDLIELNSLRFPQDIKLELNTVDRPTDDNTGDYSWRLKKIKDGLNDTKLVGNEHLTNEQVVDEFLDHLLESLEYFSNGYHNVLTDTEYTYHELSLYKRISFVRVVLQCTSHNLVNKHKLTEIHDTIGRIVTDTCCTTLLHRCYKMISDIDNN